MFLSGIEVDKQFGWPLGRAESLARRSKLPHVVLPDGAIRFDWQAVLALVRRIELRDAEVATP